MAKNNKNVAKKTQPVPQKTQPVPPKTQPVAKKDINAITNNIKLNNISKLNSDDILFYLNNVTQNANIKYTDIKGSLKYIRDIVLSSKYYDLYYNKTLYSSVSIYYILLLIPFYLNYPRMYNAKYSILGAFVAIIGIITNIKNSYQMFIKYILSYFIILFLLISLIFKFIFNKFDMVSIFIIFFITALTFNYIIRMVIPLAFKNIIPKINKDKLKKYNNNTIRKFDDNINNAINILKQKEKITYISNNQQFYLYIATFDISNDIYYKISDFITNIFQPIISVIILFLLGKSLNSWKNLDGIKLCPIIGFDSERPYFNCNSNYILPAKLYNDFNKETLPNLLKIYKPKFLNRDGLTMVKLKFYEGLYGEQMNAIKNLETSVKSNNPPLTKGEDNRLYGIILGTISTWMLIGRNLLSPMYFSKLFSFRSSRANMYKKYYDVIKNDTNLWSFVSMGTDNTYFEEILDTKYNEFMKNNGSGANKNMSQFDNNLKSDSNILMKIFRIVLFFIYTNIFYLFNNVVFGTIFVPTYINLIITAVITIFLIFIYSKVIK